ncbi:HTH-type transcriptional repressor yvoA, partial [Dysosmobacter welbionis]
EPDHGPGPGKADAGDVSFPHAAGTGGAPVPRAGGAAAGRLEHPPAQGHLQHHHLCPAAGGLPQCDPGHRHHRLAEASGRGELNRAPARKRKNLPGNGKNMKKLFDNRAHIPYNTIRVITR